MSYSNTYRRKKKKKWTFEIITAVAALLLIACAYSGDIDPQRFFLAPFMVLAFMPMLILVFVLLVLAVLRRRWVAIAAIALSLLISVVFAESVPGDLRQLLPSQGRPREKGLLINLRYVRCIVQNWDAQTIQASTADGSLVIDYGNTSEGRDFGYLRRLLREGMQLNLLDCHEEKETKTANYAHQHAERQRQKPLQSASRQMKQYVHISFPSDKKAIPTMLLFVCLILSQPPLMPYSSSDYYQKGKYLFPPCL